ncbi:MAG: large subunit ribosomal protein [Patescibacteria group bacterium]|nr:large subunit ribosomal protein [Patescibacteria group bacterium]
MAETKKTSKAAEERAKLEAIKAQETAVVEQEAAEIVATAEVAADAKEDAKTAKAGKRSAKALKEAEAKEEKEARKESGEADSKPKQKQNPPKSQLERKSKQYRKLAEQIEKGKEYSLKEALDLATKTSPVKFDATVEMHVRLGVDPRHADQNIRDMVVLPAGTGKSVCVAVFAEADAAAAALKAGADIAGEEDITKMLDKGNFDFDILIAQPAQMAKLGKYARVLGPKGLMPNPKSGTVSNDVAKAVTEAKAGRVEFRVDSTGIVHLGVGKVSFGKDKLEQNARAVLNSIKAAKPASIKGTYVNAIHVTTSMGPSISVAPTEV